MHRVAVCQRLWGVQGSDPRVSYLFVSHINIERAQRASHLELSQGKTNSFVL